MKEKVLNVTNILIDEKRCVRLGFSKADEWANCEREPKRAQRQVPGLKVSSKSIPGH
jgi:hypothetical protein